jgi:hypothetical protein
MIHGSSRRKPLSAPDSHQNSREIRQTAAQKKSDFGADRTAPHGEAYLSGLGQVGIRRRRRTQIIGGIQSFFLEICQKETEIGPRTPYRKIVHQGADFLQAPLPAHLHKSPHGEP